MLVVEDKSASYVWSFFGFDKPPVTEIEAFFNCCNSKDSSI
jgi:hypothetical protein